MSGRSKPRVVCMGELLIDFAGRPQGSALRDCESFEPNPGGAPANVAVGVSRLECPSAFVGMVGADAFGDLLQDVLDENGVDTRSLARSTSQPTTLAFVAITKAGVPSFVFYRHPGADLSITPEDVDLGVFDEAELFHFGSLSLVANPAYDTTYHCLRQAGDRGIFVTYDPNYRPALWDNEEQAVAKMSEPLPHVNLVKVSSEELALLTGSANAEEGCAILAEKGPNTIIVTRGAEGMFGWCGGRTFSVPGQDVTTVDTTGCGDASVAGCIRYLLTHGGITAGSTEVTPEVFEAALAFANRCAAHAATRPGAIPSLPRLADVSPA